MKKLILFATILFAFSIAAFAQGDYKEVAVKFDKTGAATVSGTEPIYFNFKARRGQTVTIIADKTDTVIDFYDAYQPLDGNAGKYTQKIEETNFYQVVAHPKKGGKYQLKITLK